jgi:hypothetical protein
MPLIIYGLQFNFVYSMPGFAVATSMQGLDADRADRVSNLSKGR